MTNKLLKQMMEAAQSEHGVGLRVFPESVIYSKGTIEPLWTMRFVGGVRDTVNFVVEAFMHQLVLPPNFDLSSFKQGNEVWCLSSQGKISKETIQTVEKTYVTTSWGRSWTFDHVFLNLDEALQALKEQLLAK